MGVSRLKLQAKFRRVGSDTCAIGGTLSNLPGDFVVANAIVTLDVGDGPVTFQLTAKGRGANANGSIKFSRNTKSGLWTFTGKLKANMQDSWARFGLTNNIVINRQIAVPVILLLQSDAVESFEVEPVLSYTDKSGILGTARYEPVK
jgi:hypothetical protein